jgi:hypothetical protein
VDNLGIKEETVSTFHDGFVKSEYFLGGGGKKWKFMTV